MRILKQLYKSLLVDRMPYLSCFLLNFSSSDLKSHASRGDCCSCSLFILSDEKPWNTYLCNKFISNKSVLFIFLLISDLPSKFQTASNTLQSKNHKLTPFQIILKTWYMKLGLHIFRFRSFINIGYSWKYVGWNERFQQIFFLKYSLIIQRLCVQMPGAFYLYLWIQLSKLRHHVG